MQKTEILVTLNISNKTLNKLIADKFIIVDTTKSKSKYDYQIADTAEAKEFFKTFDEQQYLSKKKEETKLKRSNSMKNYIKKHPEHLKLISQRTSEALSKCKDKLSERSKNCWASSDFRDKQKISRKAYWANDESHKKRSDIQKNIWQNHREMMITGQLKRWSKDSEHLKHSQILTEVYKSPELRQKISNKVKASYIRSGKAIFEKRMTTKKLNHTVKTSKLQEFYTDWFLSKGLTVITEAPYPNEPTTHCDWFLSEFNMYIEGHFTWTHGDKPFDATDKQCVEELEYIKSRAKTSKYYANKLYTWTNLDVRKRKAAKDSGITWFEFFTSKDLETFLSGISFNNIIVRPWDNYQKVFNQFMSKQIVYARTCDIKQVSALDAKQFLNQYHYQGSTKTSVLNLGLYYNSELVELMTFGKPRYNKNYEWELLRLCTKYNYSVIGGASKLFANFEGLTKPRSIISYCDMDKFTGAVYDKLGFTKLSQQSSTHWYSFYDRQHITDNLLRQYGADKLLGTNYGKGTDNQAILQYHGYIAIKDNGQSTYIKLYKTETL